MSLFKTEAWQTCCAELSERYSEPGRHYHTLEHIHDCLTKADAVTRDDPVAMKLAIWFHDAIYDPQRTDNEAASAELADEWLASVNASKEFRNTVSKLIIATDHKTEPITHDEKRIVDIDLSILGAPQIDYGRYAKNVRKEFSIFSDEDYCEGRKKVLSHFLNRKPLFLTQHFQERFESIARQNIKRELKQLRSR